MSLFDNMDTFSVIICPECGRDDFVNISGNAIQGNTSNAKCPNCGIYFHVSKVDAGRNGGKRIRWRTIYAAQKKNFTLDEWEWKMFFFLEDKKPQWQTYSDSIRNRRTDKRPIEDVNKLIDQKWQAHQVLLSLKFNLKK